MTEETYKKYRHAVKYLAGCINSARKTLDDLQKEFDQALEVMEKEYQQSQGGKDESNSH